MELQRLKKGIVKRFNSYKFNFLKLFNNKKYQLIILDDAFPTVSNLFRIIEYNNYLTKYDSVVMTSSSSYGKSGDRKQFKKDLKVYEKFYPELSKKVKRFNKNKPVKADLVYFMFLHNGMEFISYIEKNKIPFIFTLYPGGGFRLNQEKTDRHLKRLCSSSCFRGVIVTQNVSYRYLVEKKLCPEDKITFIYGGFPIEFKEEYRNKKKKETFDIGFVAHKYTPQGRDKGYDIFIEVARILYNKIENLRVHVVGGFDENDVNVADIKDKIVFHGTLNKDEYMNVLSEFDVFLSPNRFNVLAPGAFDGFPLGEDAGILGAAMFVTDELGQNEYFKDGEEIVIIDHDPENIANKVLYYYQHPDDLKRLAHNGQKRLTELFSHDVQMTPRYELLNKFING
ncbi:MAG: glycosyltransferase family 4 protein [Chlorobi bacterium]|nr:glycosyltransferase family 4 protein [Chlorobiota bacterium]